MELILTNRDRTSGDVHLTYSHGDKRYIIHLVRIQNKYARPNTGVVMKLVGGQMVPQTTKKVPKKSFYRPFVIDLQTNGDFDITPFSQFTKKTAKKYGEIFLLGYIKGLEAK